MIIKGKSYAFVNEKTVNGTIYSLYRRAVDKHGRDKDDCVVLSRLVGDPLDLAEVAKVKKAKSKHKETAVNPKVHWKNIEAVV